MKLEMTKKEDFFLFLGAKKADFPFLSTKKEELLFKAPKKKILLPPFENGNPMPSHSKDNPLGKFLTRPKNSLRT